MFKQNAKKKTFIYTTSILALVVIGFIVYYSNAFIKIVNGNGGITDIEINKNMTGNAILTIKGYGECHYSFHTADKSFYSSYEIKPIEGLGDYQVAIVFTDIEINDKLDKYKGFNVHSLDKVAHDYMMDFNISIVCPPSDHTYIILIGSNKPFGLKETQKGKLDGLKALHWKLQTPLNQGMVL